MDYKFTARVTQQLGWHFPESTTCESMALVLQTLAGQNAAGTLPGEGEVELICGDPATVSWETWRGPRSAWIEFLADPSTENYSRYLEELAILPNLSSNWLSYSTAEARDLFYPKNRPRPDDAQSSRKSGVKSGKGKGGKSGNGKWRANNKRQLKSKAKRRN